MSSILVTGATGTFGRAFLRRALAATSGEPWVDADTGYTGDAEPTWKRVIAYSRDEVKQAGLLDEFPGAPALRTFLGDVRDVERLRIAFRGVDAVIHAAALKRVDAGAYSPSETILTNVIGTMNVVNTAIEAGVKTVVVISSDKAVTPTNLYGASKYCAETYAVQANSYAHGKTKVMAVRYGNVLGSRGSVLHVWRKQIHDRVPVTITDLSMTRFIMTIEQAVDLVNYAMRYGVGGEVFVPVLPSARMDELAEAVAGSMYPQNVVGLRPGGEKMAEALLNDEEVTRTRRLGPHLIVTPSRHDWVAGNPWNTLHSVPAGFQYRSDTNDHWLSVHELRAMIDETEALRT